MKHFLEKTNAVAIEEKNKKKKFRIDLVFRGREKAFYCCITCKTEQIV